MLKKLRGLNWTTDLGSDQVTASPLPRYATLTYNASGEVTAAKETVPPLEEGFEFLYSASGALGRISGTSLDGGSFENLAVEQRANYDAGGLRTYLSQFFGTGGGSANDNEQMFLYDGSSLVCRWVGQWGQSGTHNFANAVSDLGQPWAPDAFVLHL